MTPPGLPTCPACGVSAAGNFCSACGAGLRARSCTACGAELSPRARFCHRCGRPAGPGQTRSSERNAWILAGLLCVGLVAVIVYRVTRDATGPVAPDMANVGAATGPAGAAPDISRMTPRERFDRLFNRIMQAAEQANPVEVQRFTPMALGAYAQLDSVAVDARYHAAVLRMQVGDLAGARALADTILSEVPGHLFGYIVRGETAELSKDAAASDRARRDFLEHYDSEMKTDRVEYLEHGPVIEEFKREAEARKNPVNGER